MRFASLAIVAAVIAFGSACSSSKGATREPTGSVCPESSTLTYSSFAEPFFATYCNSCHSSELTGADRNGAPSDHNFDTLEGIVAEADHIDTAAAAGPDAVNTVMPPPTRAEDFPDDTERQQLGEWLACGAPE